MEERLALGKPSARAPVKCACHRAEPVMEVLEGVVHCVLEWYPGQGVSPQ